MHLKVRVNQASSTLQWFGVFFYDIQICQICKFVTDVVE